MTLVLGAMLNQLSSARLEAAQLRREQAARQAEREQARLDRREDFELTHLTDLHAALGELSTTTAAYWKQLTDSETIPVESKEAFEQARQKVMRLAGLVLDDSTREAVDTASDTVGLLNLGEPIQNGMPTKPMSQAHYDLGRAEYAVASRLRDVYKSVAVTEPLQPPAALGIGTASSS
ncbi:hypothetical protein [Streptomyces sp. NBC_00474]|uniref:hypothetical protein n=1 Tax=Streptomyces sp. NBC_00474 TaxID=2975754 RepID=UPI00225B2FD0|nr:hypothetical protein [Streptomyces sp. NBC_00474]MCX5055110.1 hypothetical protein [Streptomyces sp. NBC_00474]